MSDCANVELRDLLPELVAGTLDATTRASVEEHAAACADCATEVETLRLVRTAFAGVPAIDVGRVVAALPKPRARVVAPRREAKVMHWLDWRVAAALTTITVGGLSLAVSQRIRPTEAGAPDSAQVVAALPPTPNAIAGGPSRPNVAVPRDTPRTAAAPRASGPTSAPGAETATRAQLSVGGGMGDLDDASLRALLGALDEIDRAPVAPSAEPDRSPVLPVIKAGER